MKDRKQPLRFSPKQVLWHFKPKINASKIQKQSSRGVNVEKVFLEISKQFTGKHLCQNLLLNKVAGLRPVIFLKKRLWHRCFPVNFSKFLRTFSVGASENTCEPADFREELVDLRLYYSQTSSQEVFKYVFQSA